MLRAFVLLNLAVRVLGLSAGDLQVSLKVIASTLKSVDDIVISAVISNPTDKDIRVIAKNNILDSSPTKSFSVSNETGGNVLFTGVRAMYNLSADDIYTTIPAGSSIVVNHTGFAALYDFESSGTGTFTFAPNTVLQRGPDTPLEAVNTPPVTVEVTHNVKRHAQLYRRLSHPTCSDTSRLQILTDSLSSARSLARNAATDIQIHPTSAEFTTYFGGNSNDTISHRMDIIASDLATSGTRTINCNSDPAGICSGSSGVIAYTLVATSGGAIVGSDIYTCDIFFTSVGTTPSVCTNGYDATTSSREGIILHELSHATSLTTDIAYGCSSVTSLSTPDKLNNADNYRCMGLAIYKHYDCC